LGGLFRFKTKSMAHPPLTFDMLLIVYTRSFDIDALIECDDEYWECGIDSEVTFRQPSGKPSYVTSYNSCLKLCEILAFSMRTLYSTKKAKIWSGHVGNDWQGRLVAQIDSALNRWSDSVPDHVKWDPHRENPLFFDQSTALYLLFYYVQMQIHRPIMQKDSPMSYTSLAICTNAARACGHVLDIQFRRRILSLPQVIISAFTAGVVLLFGIWSGRKEIDPQDDRAIIQSCLHALKTLEPMWHIAGRLWDMLNELANVRVPQPYKPVAPSKKRQREYEHMCKPHDSTLSTHKDNVLSSSSATQMPGPSVDPALLPQTGDIGGYPSSALEHDSSRYFAPGAGGLDARHPPSFTEDPSGTHSVGGFAEHTLGVSHPAEKADDTASHQASNSIDRVALSIWTNAPTGFDVAEWDTFITNMGVIGRT